MDEGVKMGYWFRLYTEILDDHKLADLSDRQFRTFISLLAIAKECNQDGVISMSPRQISWRMRANIKDVKSALDKLMELEILMINNGFYAFKSWKKRNFDSDSSASRTKKWRDKKNVTVTSQERHAERHGDALETETETETETEREREKKTRILEHVFLTASEYQKLIDRLGAEKTDEYIERLNNYIGSKGKKYKSHYHTILNWADSDLKGNKKTHTGFDAAGNPLKVLA